MRLGCTVVCCLSVAEAAAGERMRLGAWLKTQSDAVSSERPRRKTFWSTRAVLERMIAAEAK